MKKIFFLLSFLLFTSILFVACDKDDDDDDDASLPSYVGTWKYSQSLMGTSISNTLILNLSSFKETIASSGGGISVAVVSSGSLSVKSDKITLKTTKVVTNGIEATDNTSYEYTFKIDGSKLTLTGVGGSAGVFTKQ